jgi:hypothetical protein
MKSETQIRKELELLLEDLKFWRAKLEKSREPSGLNGRQILGNTISGLEGRQEALEWVLKDH